MAGFGAEPQPFSVTQAARAQDAFQRGHEASERGDAQASRRWLERARRISGGAVHVDAALALARLAGGDPRGAIVLLRDLLRRFDFREGWTVLAAAHRALGEPDAAAQALQQALSQHAPDPALNVMMGQVAHGAMWAGWCGLSGSGRLLVDGVDAFGQADVEVFLDDRKLCRRLPPGWRQGGHLTLLRAKAPLLGSPIAIASVLRCEGFVEWREGALCGWLWHPGEPERPPWLSVVGSDGSRRRLRLRDFAERIDAETPLARPRRFVLPQATLPDGPVRLFGEDGRQLIGSPIARPAPRRARAAGTPAIRPPNPGCDVVIPVFRHVRRTLECIAMVRETRPEGARIVVVEDASPEPELSEALDRLAATREIVLVRNATNQGFPGSANRGMQACAGRDVILLNSDTLVAPGWVEALRAAVYSASDIGTATPFSNDASILSYPSTTQRNPVPDRAETRRLMALAVRAGRDATPVEIPTGNGFCMYVRRDCLSQTGALREDVFAQGYGEENDFCLRASRLGWRHVGVPGAYVGHVGSASFGLARTALMRRNLEILNRMHPGYAARVAAHIAADPLAAARRRLDRLRFIAGRRERAVLLITHAQSGGVERVVRERAMMFAGQGIRPIVLRPDGDFCLVDDGSSAWPNLRYRMPGEIDRLAALLRDEGLLHAEVHHWLGHAPALRGLCDRLRIAYDVHVHDYAMFCPRIALVGPGGRYCGEPDLAGCAACVADPGGNLGETIAPAVLVARSAAELARARAVIAPSADTARRLARHFPAARPRVAAWEEDARFVPAGASRGDGRARVCVIGAIGVEKGYDVLLACLRDARARALALDFVVVGHTPDDDALFEAGCLDVTGPYKDAEAEALVRAQSCDLAFLPSIWPETWCFTLSLAWRAGLAAAVFDLGAQAERVRRTGWGPGCGTVLPLGLGVAAVNDSLHQLCHHRALPIADAVTTLHDQFTN